MTAQKNFPEDVVKYWTSKLDSTMHPLAVQALRVLTIPRSGAVIESAFSIVSLLQSNRRINLKQPQTEVEMMIRANLSLLDI